MASSREGFILRSAVVFASVAASLKEEILLPNGWPKRVRGGLSVLFLKGEERGARPLHLLEGTLPKTWELLLVEMMVMTMSSAWLIPRC